MSKKKKNSLGRALIKDRFSKRGIRGDSLLHTSELNDGYDWGRLNLQSVTEESSFQEFLSTAQLAGTEFQAEKLNVKFVNANVGVGLLSKEERARFEKKKQEMKNLLKIPRRPKWDETTTTEELQQAEREDFLEWRRSLALLQDEDKMILTPYEKNLEFWRQLWRVVERSDVIVQILDARNPLLFRCEDLEQYVKEVDSNKLNMLLINKSDFLTETQRKIWSKYFDKVGIKAAFFSAKNTLDVAEEEKFNEDENKTDSSEPFAHSEQEKNSGDDSELDKKAEIEEKIQNLHLKEKKDLDEFDKVESDANEKEDSGKNSSRLLDRNDLIELFRGFRDMSTNKCKEYVTIGLVGYPNVGKSSTINALIADKKVSVSATPGKTKHFQTIYLNKEVLLCDCPGLVMPSFVSTQAEMVLHGILPIDQMRDHVSPTALLASLIPRQVIEAEYGIMIPKPADGEDPDRTPTAEELLNAYAYCRGFMTQNGQPDNPRAARQVLKDFTTGRLLYCLAPPGLPQDQFHQFKKVNKKPVQLTARATRAILPVQTARISGENFDKSYFCGAHKKGVQKIEPSNKPNEEKEITGKPWKNHKDKRNKKEKLRRVYRHLDE